MKTCPICHSGAFDDARICYGCLHRFTDEEPAVSVERPPVGPTAPGGGPALLISVQAVSGGDGAVEWRCDADGRSLTVPLAL